MAVLLLGLMFLPGFNLPAADSVEEALQRGLVAEEGQRNLTAAREAYAEAVRQGESQREALASAIFRLADVQRRLGDTAAARAGFIRLIQEYPEQTNLVALARREVPAAPNDGNESLRRRTQMQDLMARLAVAEAKEEELGTELESLGALSSRDLAIRLGVAHPTPLLTTLLQDESTARQHRSRLSPDFGPQHPEVLRLDGILKTINSQIDEVVRAIVGTLQQRRQFARNEAESLGRQIKDLEEKQRSAPSGPYVDEPMDDADRYLREEIALARQQVEIAEKKFNAGQGTQEDAIKARRELLALQRQLANRRDLVDVILPSAPAVTTDPVPVSDEEREELARLRQLAAESPDLLRRAGSGGTPLQRAAEKGWTNAVTYLLDVGVPPDDAGKTDRGTALHRAARAGNLPLVTLLLDRGADVNSRGNIMETPLHAAVRAGHRAVAERLIERGALLDERTGYGGIRYSGWEQDIYGNTPLHLAVVHGMPTLVELLASRGAELNAINFDGWTPLGIAASLDQPAILARLLAAGADPNRVGAKFDGMDQTVTPLQVETVKGNVAMVRALLAAGASPRLALDGNPPLHYAARNNRSEIANLLLQAGADANGRNWQDFTPLDLVPDSAADLIAVLRNAGGTNQASLDERATLRQYNNGYLLPLHDANLRPRNVAPPVVQAQGNAKSEPPGFYLRGELSGRIHLPEETPLFLRPFVASQSVPPTADLSQVTLQRVDARNANGERTNLVMDLRPAASSPTNPGPQLLPGDIILVPAKPVSTAKP